MLNQARQSFSGRQELTFTVSAEYSGWRLDRFLAEALQENGISRERAKKLIQEQAVFVNGKPAPAGKTAIFPVMSVTVFLPDDTTEVIPEQGDLEVLYEDGHLAVVNKPPALTVHPCPSCPAGTLVHRLVARFPALTHIAGERPGIIHRLDKDTSGLLLVALSEACRLHFAGQFADRSIFKEYLALVYGVPQTGSGCIEAPIGRDEQYKTRMAVTPKGKSAKTAWRVLYADEDKRFSLLAARIFTGRTHQIRVHMAHMGHPLLGDSLYTPSLAVRENSLPAQGKRLARRGVLDQEEGKKSNALQAYRALEHIDIPRQMLHAWQLAFYHPWLPETPPSPCCRQGMPDASLLQKDAGTPLWFTLPPPDDFTGVLERLVCGLLPVVITGSPGCGKSTLLRSLGSLEYPIMSADALVQELYKPGQDGSTVLRARFGDRFMDEGNGGVDKIKLGAGMQQDPALRKEVEALLHPLVFHRIRSFFADAKKQGAEFAFVEIPLYFENRRDACQAGNDPEHALLPHGERPVVVGVHAPFSARSKRLAENRHWPDDKIAAIESWQIPENEKMKLCDLVVANEDLKAGKKPEAAMREAAEKLLDALQMRRKSKATAVLPLIGKKT